MLRTLADKVRPEHCGILIVDVQNDFCAEGGAMHREGRDLSQVKAMVPRLARLIEAAQAAKVRCIWIRNVYNTGPNWYLSEVWLEHAQRRRPAPISAFRSASRTHGTAISTSSNRYPRNRS